MSLKAQVHLLAEKYGWTIEYIMALTRTQLKSLLDGESEMLDLKESQSKNPSMSNKKSKVTTGKGDSIYEIMSMPGMKITEKTKKALMKIREKKIKQKEKDARK